MEFLDVRNVKKIYSSRFSIQKVQALTNVSFQVEKGEYVAIMGESGSGKTTLLNILATLDKPTSGSVYLEGKNLAEIKEKEIAAFRREHLGFVFQDFHLLETFSNQDNIFLPLVLSKKNYEEALKLLNQYKEYNRGDSYIDQLTATIEISNAFEAKDYAQMVELASELYSDYSEDPRVILQYASALSCEYAATDNIDDFNKSRELIGEALKYELDDSNVDYLNRIEYRLNTKKIISADEYHQLEKEGKL